MRKNYGCRSKRVIAGAVAIIMLVVMGGCGGNKGKNTQPASDSQGTGTQAVENGQDTGVLTGVYEDAGQYDEYSENMLIDGCETACDVAIGGEPVYYEGEEFNTNEYDDLEENPWLSVKSSPLSTFAADVDTASYTNIRSNIENGYGVPASSVRIEEMINYFHYDYERPEGDDKFAVHTEYADCPWNDDAKLALVSLNTEKIDFEDAPESNLVFLIDVSGSMFDSNKLPLIQQSLCLLTENLTEKDRVSIVTYAGVDSVVLEGEPGNNYNKISRAIERLEAGGSTNGSAGINTAYEIAEEYFIEGGNNRVILATDGDLNVGITSEGELEKLITARKESGVFLSVLGVGYGNYKDNKLETLADKGNGNYSYIDSVYEARKALVDEMGANMVTVAKDVKLQVEFNPKHVKGYRLIGYENRSMAAEDFADDTKDGGEMGAGHSVTALYEIVLTDSDMEIETPELKYDGEVGIDDRDAAYDSDYTIVECGDFGDEIFTLNVRYKEAEADESKLNSYVCTLDDYSKNGSDNLRWAAAVAAFGMYLKGSEYMGSTDMELILSLAESAALYSEDIYRMEFISLVNQYEVYTFEE